MSVKVIGHRGAGRTDSNPFNENLPPQHSLESYKKVIDDGADGFEFDIFLSKDAIPVVIHRKGALSLKVSEHSFAALSDIKLEDGGKIHSLEETLIFFAQANADRSTENKLIINAELKGSGVVVPTLKIVEKVEREYGLDRDNIFYDALEWERVAEMKKLDPAANVMPALSTARLFNIASGTLPDAEQSYDPDAMRKLEEFVITHNCCAIDLMTADIRPDMIALAKKLNVGFCSYPQGPHPKENADLIYKNMGLLLDFAAHSTKPVIMKVEDTLSTQSLLDDFRADKPISLNKIEKMMGHYLV